MITADTIRRSLQCGNHSCNCQKLNQNVHCPAHADSNPSLSVTDKDGKVLVKCHAGCAQSWVIAALKEKGLWPSGKANKGAKAKKELIASYEYRDAAGNLLFEVCRFRNPDSSKTFSQRRPITGGGSIWGLRAGEYQCFNNSGDWYPVGKKGPNPMAAVKKFPATQLVLYRLPELLAADPAVLVYILEGEKDVDRLRALGMVGTCNPMGAGKWRKEYDIHLQGRELILLPDNDQAGRDHAQKIAINLHGVAASVKIVELPALPEKGDFSDWLDAGGTVDQLQGLVEAASEFDPATVLAPDAETTIDKATKKGSTEEELSQQEILLNIAAAAELFHTPDDECYARFPVNEHLETWAIRSKGFRRWLSHGFYKYEGKGPNADAMQSALNVLEAQAQFDGPERPVWVRVAEHEGDIFLDLGNPAWEAVKITPRGWEVIADPPVCFRRSLSMLPLPCPERGGNLNDLRPFLNVASDADFLLMVAFIIAALRARGPYPILVENGEQGTAKTTTARAIGALIDPSTSPLRSAPREVRDLMIAATNSWLMGYDNLSGVPDWISDALCRLSTGGGFSTRELYTDREETIFEAMRPITLNGIDSLANRQDLADRALIFNLPQIPKEARRPEKEFWADFDKVRPRILGALLDAVSMALRNQTRIKLPTLPRMADFALWVTAAEPALPWPSGSFMAAYTGNRQEAVELSLEADVVAVAVRAHMADKEEWSGTPSELYEALKEHVAENTQKSKGWPKAAHVLTNRLKRAGTFLRKVGLIIDFGKSGNRQTTITRQRMQNGVQSAQSVQGQQNQGTSPDASKNMSVQRDGGNVHKENGYGILDASVTGMDASQKEASTRKADNHAGLDGMDAAGASLHPLEDDILEVEL